MIWAILLLVRLSRAISALPRYNLLMKKLSILRLTLSLAPMVMALALAMDVYVPAIPHMSHVFHVSDNIMLLTLNIFMLTAGIMQLVVGPLSDHYGRKKIAYLAVTVFAIGCVFCAISPNPFYLIASRVIQSIGSCAMLVIGNAIVRDCYQGNESAKVYSYLNGIISFSPMFAPFIGSFLDIYFGWQATFLWLLTIALWAYCSLFFTLPETASKTQRCQLDLRDIIKQYRLIFTDKRFAWYNLSTCFGLAYLYLFCALSPYLIIRELHIPESQYGLYFCFMGISFFVGSAICSSIVERLGIFNTCLIGFVISFLGGLGMAISSLVYGLTMNGFIYPMLLVGIGGTFCLGAGTGGSMAPFGEHTGAAAALGGTLRFVFASFLGYLVINDHVASTLPLGLPAIIFSLIGIAFFLYYKRDITSPD